jgi:hypothetical protein
MSILGKCNCGGINFTINKEKIITVLNCHCNFCRSMNGSAFSSYVVVNESDFNLLHGQELIHSHLVSENATKSFCNRCGSPIYNSNPKYYGLTIIYLGILENCPQIKIDVNIFCESELTWVKDITKITSFKESTKSELFNRSAT